MRISFAFLTVVFLAGLMPTDGRAESSPPPPRIAVTVVHAPDLWIDGRPLSDRPSADQAADFEERMARWSAALGPAIIGGSPPPDPSLILEHVRVAQALIEEETDLPDAWRWSEVRRIALQVGDSIPLLVTPVTEGGPEFSYEVRSNRFSAQDQWLTDTAPEQIARVLVHEATHAVFRNEVLRVSSYTADEWASLSLHCLDIYRAQTIATEAVAHFNEERWATVHRLELTNFRKRDMLASVVAARTGTPGGVRWFAGNLLGYASYAARFFGLRHEIASCGAPVILRGPHRGEYFLPQELAQDILDPVFDEIASFYTTHRFDEN